MAAPGFKGFGTQGGVDAWNKYNADERRKAEEKKRSLTQLQNGEDLRNLSRQGLLDAQNRQAPQAQGAQVGAVRTSGYSQLMGGPQDQARAQQMAEANRLRAIASGAQMGAGQMAVRQEGNRAIAQQQAQARMARGAGAAIAARGAATNTANIGLNVAGQAGAAQRADAAQASQTMSGLLGQTREQDIGFAGQNAQLRQQTNLANMDAQNQRIFQQAGLDQATSLANMQARLQTMGLNDQMAYNYLQQLYGIDETELRARLAMEGKDAGQSTGRQLLGGALVAGGTILGGIYGGPAGAAAGGSAGAAINGSV